MEERAYGKIKTRVAYRRMKRRMNGWIGRRDAMVARKRTIIISPWVGVMTIVLRKA